MANISRNKKELHTER